MANWERFVDKWNSSVARFHSDDGLPEWKNYVAGCVDEILSVAVERLGDSYAMQRNSGKMASVPRLPDLKRSYWSAEKHAEDSRRQITDCPYCRGTGTAVAAGGRKSGGSYWTANLRRGVFPVSEIEAMMVPCFCQAGRDYHAKKCADYKETIQSTPEDWQQRLFRDWKDDQGVWHDAWSQASGFVRKCQQLASQAEPTEDRRDYE